METHKAIFEITKPLLIINPDAGEDDYEEVEKVFTDACSRYGWQAEIHETEKGENYAAVVMDNIKKGCDLVIASGGDGTVGAVASAMVGSDIPLVIIPAGTGNLLAKQLNLPFKPEEILQFITDSPDKLLLDVMKIGDSHHLINVSIGLSAEVIRNTSSEDKRRFGNFAYYWSAARAFIGFQPHRFEISIDEKDIHVTASEIFISNISLSEEDFPDSGITMQPDDGKLELFVFRARSLWDFLWLGVQIMFGRGRQAKEVMYFPITGRVKINANKNLPVQADGDVIGRLPVTIEVVPQAVTLLIPREGRESSSPIL